MPIAVPPTAPSASRARSDRSLLDRSLLDRSPLPVEAARIGPNAIIQVTHVLEERFGRETADTLLSEATGYHLETLPGAMVPEQEALALTHRVMGYCGEAQATLVLREAGLRTGDYLLAHRIPRAAQWIMRRLPRRAGLSLLLKAMSAHAWTFAGSGTFTVQRTGAVVELCFHQCAMCRELHSDGPVCDFYAGTFERLIRTIVSPTARVREVECQAQGGRHCRFQVNLG
jgi:divinyl protochlorophyllide a 8-vinyl-reductase